MVCRRSRRPCPMTNRGVHLPGSSLTALRGITACSCNGPKELRPLLRLLLQLLRLLLHHGSAVRLFAGGPQLSLQLLRLRLRRLLLQLRLHHGSTVRPFAGGPLQARCGRRRLWENAAPSSEAAAASFLGALLPRPLTTRLQLLLRLLELQL